MSDMETPASKPQVDKAAFKQATVRGVTISYATQFVKLGLQFASQVIIARLLFPKDFGLVAMAAPVIAFATLFADLGLTQATVQRQLISQAEQSFLFWISLFASFVSGLIVICAAPLAVAFYGEPRVGLIVVALGVIVMSSGVAAQQKALLNRHLRFGALATVDLMSLLIGSISGVLMALAGWSYWSIVGQQAASSLVSLIMYWWLSGWKPSRPSRITSARSLLSFGGNVTTFNFVNFFARNLDNVLIGKVLGEAPLGLYDRAYKLLLLPLNQITQPIGRVAQPLLARSLQDEPLYQRTYFRLLELVLMLTYPGIIFAGLASHDLIITVLGKQWEGAAPIFAVLAIGGLFAPISNSTGWLFTTQDRTGEMRNYGVLSSAAFAMSFIVGLRWGPLGVASCYIAVGCIQGPLVWWAATRKGPVSTQSLVRVTAAYALASLMTAVVIILGTRYLPSSPVTLGILLVSAYVTFLAGLTLTAVGRKSLGDVWRQGQSILRKMRSRASA
jgi:PST family polysaccharide transporter